MVKILNVLGSIDSRDGGPPVSARNIWIAARRSGAIVESAVCVTKPQLRTEVDGISEVERADIKVYQFRFCALLPRLAKRWGISFRLAFWLFCSVKRYDIIQVHSSWMFSTIVAVIAARVAKRRIILIPHESLTTFDMAKGGAPAKGSLKALIKRHLLRFIDTIVFSSRLEERDSLEREDKIRRVVIYHPARSSADALAHRRTPVRGSGLNVGFLGRFDPKKNIEHLIQALKYVPGLTLRIGGDGPASYKEQLMSLATSIGVQNRIEWLGFIKASESTGFFDSIDVLAMPSQYECFGRVAAEAIAHRVPPIVSNTSGVAELVERYKCGIIVSPEAASVQNALEKLNRDPSGLDNLRRQTFRAQDEELSLEAYGRRIASVYLELLSNSSA